MRKTFKTAAYDFIQAEMRYLIPYIVSYSLVILMLTGARGRKAIYEAPGGGYPVLFSLRWVCLKLPFLS